MSRNTRTATTRLGAAEVALEQANARLVELRERRIQLLLQDKDAEAAQIAGEIQEHERLARGHEDKIALLKTQAAQEAVERRAKENEAQNKRIDALFNSRDEDIAKLAALEEQRVTVWRRVLDTNRKIVAAHNWTSADLSAVVLVPALVNATLAHESFRLSYTPRLLGGQQEAPDAGLSLPGSKSPRVEWELQPERILPMADVFAAASEHGKARLRGKSGTVVNNVPIVNGAPQQGVADALPGEATNGGDAPAANVQGESPLRTAAEARLGLELRELNRLSNDTSPAGQIAYDAKLEKVRQAQDAVAAEQGIGVQGHARRS
jgi:hypothetical protein